MKNLGIELLPNTLFSGASTPGSGITVSDQMDFNLDKKMDFTSKAWC